jgi:hypothetical protein
MRIRADGHERSPGNELVGLLGHQRDVAAGPVGVGPVDESHSDGQSAVDERARSDLLDIDDRAASEDAAEGKIRRQRVRRLSGDAGFDGGVVDLDARVVLGVVSNPELIPDARLCVLREVVGDVRLEIWPVVGSDHQRQIELVVVIARDRHARNLRVADVGDDGKRLRAVAQQLRLL